MAETPRAWRNEAQPPASGPPGKFLPPTERPPPPQPPPPPPVALPVGRTSGQAVASLVLGIAGLIILPIVCSVLAIVFGNLARKETERDPTMQGRGIATAGLIMGIAGLGLWVLVIVVALAAA